MTVRTILGDVDGSELGPTLVHEHLILDSPLIARDHPHIHLPSVDDAVAEVGACAAVGIGCMVDAMPAAGGRHPDRLASISRRTGVSIVATTGLHTSKYYAEYPWALEADPDVIAPMFIADIDDGIDRNDHRTAAVERTACRAGIVKIASEGPALGERDKRLIAAAVRTARATGVPVLTHCEGGLGGLAQINEFRRHDFPLDRVVLSHTDKVDDVGYHADLLDAGVNLEYDQSLRHHTEVPHPTARLVAWAVEAGFVGQVMVGTDGARRSLWAALGGAPGLPWMRSRFVDLLLEHAVDEAWVEAIFVTNPARFLTMEAV